MKTSVVRYVLVVVLILAATPLTAEAKGGKTPKYPIASSAGPNGKIKPSGTQQVKSGASKAYTATPNNGYQATISLDGQVVATGGVSAKVAYTVSNVTAAHTVHADFALP